MSDVRNVKLRINDYSETAGIYPIRYIAPDYCPACNVTFSSLDYKHILRLSDYGNGKLYCFSVCPRCESGFIAEYTSLFDIDRNTDYLTDFGNYEKLQPVLPNKVSFDPLLKNVSSRFEKIYNDANAAEQYCLYEICGIGYRKAFEFLIKDFLLYVYDNKEESFRNAIRDETSITKLLRPEVYNIIPEDIANAAKRCAWLGNDQTHYVVKHTDKDLQDFKKAIDTIVIWITMQLHIDDLNKIQPIK